MQFYETCLPWNGVAVKALDGVGALLSAGLDGEGAKYLPREITLFADTDVEDVMICSFISEAHGFLRREMLVRYARTCRLVNTGLIQAEELDRILTGREHAQKWGLYFSRSGGLGPVSEADTAKDRGVVPCSTMQNHGVGWCRSSDGVGVWLVTSRQSGSDWDMDSDIGHESAHAAFAPVPLFVQPVSGALSLADVQRADNLTPSHIARMLYLYCELAVVGIRGERRPTNTRLPVNDPEELYSLFAIGDELFPNAGFKEALRVCESSQARFDPYESDRIFDLAAPILRLLPKLNALAKCFEPPLLAELRSIGKNQPSPD